MIPVLTILVYLIVGIPVFVLHRWIYKKANNGEDLLRYYNSLGEDSGRSYYFIVDMFCWPFIVVYLLFRAIVLVLAAFFEKICGYENKN